MKIQLIITSYGNKDLLLEVKHLLQGFTSPSQHVNPTKTKIRQRGDALKNPIHVGEKRDTVTPHYSKHTKRVLKGIANHKDISSPYPTIKIINKSIKLHLSSLLVFLTISLDNYVF